MANIVWGSKFRVPMGPFDLWPQANKDANGRVRLSQQYLEVIHSGGDNRVRLSQQYLEIIHEFGTPPPKPKKPPPGQTKKIDLLSESVRAKIFRDRKRRCCEFATGLNAILYTSEYRPPAEKIRFI